MTAAVKQFRDKIKKNCRKISIKEGDGCTKLKSDPWGSERS